MAEKELTDREIRAVAGYVLIEQLQRKLPGFPHICCPDKGCCRILKEIVLSLETTKLVFAAEVLSAAPGSETPQ